MLIVNLRKLQNNSQAIANILRDNQQHLELLCLQFFRLDQRVPLFLPPNLKHLSVRHYGDEEALAELAAEQCPKLCGIGFCGRLTLRTINAISRFEKFIVYLTICIIYKIIIYFSLTFLSICPDPEHGEALGVVFRSGSLRHLQGLVLNGENNFKVLLTIIIRFSGKLNFPSPQWK